MVTSTGSGEMACTCIVLWMKCTLNPKPWASYWIRTYRFIKMGVKMDGWVWGLEFGPVYFLHRMDAVVPLHKAQNSIKWMILMMRWRRLILLGISKTWSSGWHWWVGENWWCFSVKHSTRYMKSTTMDELEIYDIMKQISMNIEWLYGWK